MASRAANRPSVLVDLSTINLISTSSAEAFHALREQATAAQVAVELMNPKFLIQNLLQLPEPSVSTVPDETTTAPVAANTPAVKSDSPAMQEQKPEPLTEQASQTDVSPTVIASNERSIATLDQNGHIIINFLDTHLDYDAQSSEGNTKLAAMKKHLMRWLNMLRNAHHLSRV